MDNDDSGRTNKEITGGRDVARIYEVGDEEIKITKQKTRSKNSKKAKEKKKSEKQLKVRIAFDRKEPKDDKTEEDISLSDNEIGDIQYSSEEINYFKSIRKGRKIIINYKCFIRLIYESRKNVFEERQQFREKKLKKGQRKSETMRKSTKSFQQKVKNTK